MAKRVPKETIDKVAWANPPPRRALYDWAKIAEQLKAKPMEWGLVFKGDRTSVVNALRQGAVGAMHPEGGFEFRTANNVRDPVRTCDLYVRFNPAKVKPLRATIAAQRKKGDD